MPINHNPDIIEPRVVGSREAICGILCDNNGDPVDLTDKTITCRIVRVDVGTVIVAGSAATIDDAEAGKVHYTPTADDATAMTVGRYACYFLDTTSTPVKRYPFDGPKRILDVRAEG